MRSANPGDASTAGVSNANDEERSEARELRASRAFYTYVTDSASQLTTTYSRETPI
jgi:hypothetical protein